MLKATSFRWDYPKKSQACPLTSFLKNIDDSNKSFQIFAYITSDKTKFVYLSNSKDDRREDRIKAMFTDLHFYFANVALIDRYEPTL